MRLELDKGILYLTKNHWTSDEILTAKCMGFDIFVNTVKVTLKKTSKKSLHLFLKGSFRSFVNSKTEFRDELFDKIKNYYDETYRSFDENYLSKLKYRDKLYDYQVHDITESAYKDNLFLFYEQGLGKTLTSGTISKSLDYGRTVIISPSIAKYNWYDDLACEWEFGEFYFTVIDRDYKKQITAMSERFCITNFHMVNKFFKHLSGEPVDCFIVDEVHFLKNPKTDLHRNVKRLFKQHPNARKILMTGTPIANRVNDLYGYLSLIDHPLAMKGWKYFNSRYIARENNTKTGKIVGVRNVSELRSRISNIMIRRTADDELDLPPLLLKRYYMDPIFEDAYNDSIEDLRSINSKQKLLDAKIKKAEQLENYELVKDLKAELRETNFKGNSSIHAINNITAQSKVKPVIELSKLIIEEGRKVVIFSPYLSPLKKIKDQVGNAAVVIDGSVPAHERSLREKEFKSNDNVKFFLAQVIAGGTAINLVNASDLIFIGFPFTVEHLLQPIKRIHRIGQQKNCRIYLTVGRDTVDEHIYDLVAGKIQDATEVLDNDSNNNIDYSSVQSVEGEVLKRFVSNLK